MTGVNCTGLQVTGLMAMIKVVSWMMLGCPQAP